MLLGLKYNSIFVINREIDISEAKNRLNMNLALYKLYAYNNSSLKGLLSFLMTYLSHTQNIFAKSKINEINQDLTRNLVPETLGKKFKIAIYDFLADNIKKRRSEEIEPSPDLLNTINLTGGQSCLQTIVVSQFFKIYHQFSNLKQRTFHSFSVQIHQNFSWPNLTDLFCIELNINSAQYQVAEFLKKELKMDFRVIEGGLSDKFQQNSAEIQPGINNSAKKYSSRKDFALSFIKKTKVNLTNFSSHEAYKFLSKNEKDAVRYYLKKDDSYSKELAPKKTTKKKTKKREVLELKTASVLMIPVICSECIILTFSYLFYMDLGFSLAISLMAAISVEIFFMASSGSTKLFLRSLRWVIFCYSAFTVSYSTYIKDPKILSYKQSNLEVIKGLEYRLRKKRNYSASLEKQQAAILADMEVYRKNELVSKGRAKLAGEKNLLRTEVIKTDSEISSLINQINLMKENNTKRSVFSKENMQLVEVRSWVVMFFLTLIQFLSSIFTSEFCTSFRNYKKKNKQKRSKGEFYGHVPSYISVQ